MTSANFPCNLASVALARAFVSRLLTECPLAVSRRVALMTSELATNSVIHARTPFRVCVDMLPNLVRVEVHDAGDGGYHVRPRSDAAGGRGLLIVRELAQRSGVESIAKGQHMAWFESSLVA